MSLALNPFTVHEADVAVFYAWRDGRVIDGPMPRHLQSGMVAKFRASLNLTRKVDPARAHAFGDWRHPESAEDGLWTVEMTYPIGSVVDEGGAHVSSSMPAGEDMTVLVRFFDELNGHWRVFQFHHARRSADLTTAEQQELGINTLGFTAAWMEPFRGGNAADLPPLVPREWGVIEWIHGARRIPCHYYDPATDSWTETGENFRVDGGETLRYVTLETTAGLTTLSYLAPITAATTTAGGIDASKLAWIDALAFAADSSGLHPAHGWQVQTGGGPEPLTIPPSGRHWEHPRVVIRFLGRVYASLAHGTIATPALVTGPPSPSIDPPIRLGPSLAMLPAATHVLP